MELEHEEHKEHGKMFPQRDVRALKDLRRQRTNVLDKVDLLIVLPRIPFGLTAESAHS